MAGATGSKQLTETRDPPGPQMFHGVRSDIARTQSSAAAHQDQPGLPLPRKPKQSPPDLIGLIRDDRLTDDPGPALLEKVRKHRARKILSQPLRAAITDRKHRRRNMGQSVSHLMTGRGNERCLDQRLISSPKPNRHHLSVSCSNSRSFSFRFSFRYRQCRVHPDTALTALFAQQPDVRNLDHRIHGFGQIIDDRSAPFTPVRASISTPVLALVATSHWTSTE